MLKKFKSIAPLIAAAVAGLMVVSGTVIAQSSSGASSPAINDRTSSGFVGDAASAPARRSVVSTPAESTPANSANANSTDRSAAGAVTGAPAANAAGGSTDAHANASGSRTPSHARAARSDRN